MRRTLILAISIVLSVVLVICLTGCGEDSDDAEELPVKLMETNPVSGDTISANGSLVINFDIAVTEVKVNGMLAEVAGSSATWKGQSLQIGSQSFMIDWIDANGNSGSQDITLTVESADTIQPEVTSISIEDGASDLDANELNDAGIVIEFSERIDTAKSEGAIALAQGENPISWDLEWSEGDTKAVLKPGPKNKLGSGSEYTLTIGSYFDGAGNEDSKVESDYLHQNAI
ncbi:Ig-like domain-containing protein [Candidatus Poribacteria bacterium]